MVHCFHCKKKLDLPEKVPFRATCDSCGRYVHCCKNCRFYNLSLSNSCAIPGTETVADRMHMNYCEEFSPLKEISNSSPTTSSKDKFDNLFKDF